MALTTAWWQAINRAPDIKVPTPVMPVPNAHDDFVAASQAIVNGSKVDVQPGGTIDVTPGPGARFEVRLPLQSAALAAAVTPDAHTQELTI